MTAAPAALAGSLFIRHRRSGYIFIFSSLLYSSFYALRPVVGMDCAPFTLRQSRRAHTATSFLLFRKKSRSRCLSPCKRGLYTAAGSLPTFCEDAPRQKGTKDRRRGKAPFGNPLGTIYFFGKAGPYPCPATSDGRSGGGLFPSPVQFVPPRSAPTCPPLVSENIIGSLKNPTTGDDECGKVSKGALPLWSVRRGFRRGTHRKGSPWCSLHPF